MGHHLFVLQYFFCFLLSEVLFSLILIPVRVEFIRKGELPLEFKPVLARAFKLCYNLWHWYLWIICKECHDISLIYFCLKCQWSGVGKKLMDVEQLLKLNNLGQLLVYGRYTTVLQIRGIAVMGACSAHGILLQYTVSYTFKSEFNLHMFATFTF